MNTILQTALDLTELSRAMQIAREAVLGGTDWIEAGTPLIKSEGMNAVRELAKEFPNHKIIADLKTSDTGGLEVEMAAKAGADVVCILASADDAVILDALRGAALYGVELMADMMNVAVHPDFRRKGIAEALVNTLVEELKAIDSHCLMLEVRASNVPAISLYEKLGFREVGRRKNYYRNPREDALILRKEWEI